MPVSLQMTLADRIKDALTIKYPPSQDISRILTCWDNFVAGKKLERYLLDEGNKEFLQTADCFVDGLSVQCFHDMSRYSWTKPLEASYEVILNELINYENQRRLSSTIATTTTTTTPSHERDLSQLKPTGDGLLGDGYWLGPRDTSAGSYGPEWRTLGLQDRSVWNPELVPYFPKTVEIVEKLAVPACEVFFSKQGPHSGIKPHSDRNNFIITCHLGLDVPEGECSIKVGNEEYFWKNGQAQVFDTSVIHSTENKSDRTRYVLMLRIWHPELSAVEIDAFKFIFGYLDHSALGDEALREYEMKHLLLTGQGKEQRSFTANKSKETVGKVQKAKAPIGEKKGFGKK
eukprot:gene1547-1685_t